MTAQRIVAVQLKHKESFGFSHWIRQTIAGNDAARQTKIIKRKPNRQKTFRYKENTWHTNALQFYIILLAHGGSWQMQYTYQE